VIPASLAVRLLPARAAVTAILLAVPGALLAAGLPLRSLEPDAWPGYVASLIRLLGRAMPPGNLHAGAQSIAAAALLAGTMWTVGAALGASASRRRVHTRWSRLQLAVGFVLVATPWLVLVSLRRSEGQAWQGAVVLIAGVLWFCAERRALILALIAAVPGAALVSAVGTPDHWVPAGGGGGLDPTFTTLDVVPTYAPLEMRSTGATMLTITAPAPALWGM
jgi:hypothetical protein